MPKKPKHTLAQLTAAVAAARSYAQVLRQLGLKPAGGNYKSLQKWLNEAKISTAHFYGCGWNRGADYKNPRKITPTKNLLVKNSNISPYKLKLRLIREKIKQEQCEICRITTWQNKPIAFHLDHINGDNRDNRLKNLRIVCPNCHAQTETYCGKNWGKYAKGT